MNEFKRMLKLAGLSTEKLNESIYGTPAFEKITNRNREFPKWDEMTAEEIQTYIDENPDTLWGRDLGIAKMVRDNKLEQDKLEQGELNESEEDTDMIDSIEWVEEKTIDYDPDTGMDVIFGESPDGKTYTAMAYFDREGNVTDIFNVEEV